MHSLCCCVKRNSIKKTFFIWSAIDEAKTASPYEWINTREQISVELNNGVDYFFFVLSHGFIKNIYLNDLWRKNI